MNFCFCSLVWIFIIDNHRNVDSRSQWREFSFICFQVTERTRCMWACIYQAKGDIVVITSTIILNVKRTVPIRIMSTTIGPVSCRRLHFCFHISLAFYSHLFPRRNLAPSTYRIVFQQQDYKTFPSPSFLNIGSQSIKFYRDRSTPILSINTLPARGPI